MLKLMNMQDLVSSQNQGLPCLFSKIVATSAFCGFAYNQISLTLKGDAKKMIQHS